MKTSTPTTTWDVLPHDWQSKTTIHKKTGGVFDILLDATHPSLLKEPVMPSPFSEGQSLVIGPEPEPETSATFLPIENVLRGLEKILRYKNKAYGNSALSGDGVFSKAGALDKLLARADDKLARIKNSEEMRKNDYADILGYIVLICAAKGWDDFSEFCD